MSLKNRGSPTVNQLERRDFVVFPVKKRFEKNCFFCKQQIPKGELRVIIIDESEDIKTRL